jgi:hypothetical protein
VSAYVSTSDRLSGAVYMRARGLFWKVWETTRAWCHELDTSKKIQALSKATYLTFHGAGAGYVITAFGDGRKRQGPCRLPLSSFLLRARHQGSTKLFWILQGSQSLSSGNDCALELCFGGCAIGPWRVFCRKTKDHHRCVSRALTVVLVRCPMDYIPTAFCDPVSWRPLGT